MNLLARRHFVNNLMLSLTGVCTVITVSTLFLILGYLIWNGGTSLDWNFFTKLPLPPGEIGGGMANAIVGSAILIAIATLIGVPVGFVGGICREDERGPAGDLLHHRRQFCRGAQQPASRDLP